MLNWLWIDADNCLGRNAAQQRFLPLAVLIGFGPLNRGSWILSRLGVRGLFVAFGAIYANISHGL